MKQPKEPTLTDVFKKIDSIMDIATTASPAKFQLPTAHEIVQELITTFPILEQYLANPSV